MDLVTGDPREDHAYGAVRSDQAPAGARVAAVVPATDERPTLAACLAAIESADDPPDHVVVVREPSRAGPAEARNVGVERADADVIVFVDADVLVHPDVFTRVRAAFATDPGLAAVFGSYDDDPAEPGTVSTFRNLLHHYVHQRSPGPATTFWTGLGAVRRDALDRAGGFDADLHPRSSIEDIELGLRLATQGARIVLDPGLQGKHLKRWTFGSMVVSDFAERGVPWVRLLVRERTSSAALNLGWRHRLSAAASLGALSGFATRRPRRASVAVATLLALNRPFYAFVRRRRGSRVAVASVGLHLVHHLVSVAALVVGLAIELTSAKAPRS